MSGAAGWLKATVGAMARVAPGPTARLAHSLYRRPAVARRFDTGTRALLGQADEIVARGDEIWTDTPVGRMRAVHFRPTGAPKGLVLLLHGWTADARAMAAFVDPLLAAGWEALIPDLPAHGASEGRETDAPAAARAVAALLNGRTPEAFIGHSFGGGVAGLLADDGIAPRRFACLASPSRLRFVTDDFCAAFGLTPAAQTRFESLVRRSSGAEIDHLDGLRIWPEKSTRILLLHAPDDMEVDFAEAERLSALPNAELRPMPGLGHRVIVYHPDSVGAAVAFVTG